MDIFSIKGNIYRLKKSKRNGKLIAYADTGKVIIPDNQGSLHHGFAKITSFIDKGNCFVAQMENVVHDFYYGYEDEEVIPYDELVEVFKLYGFKHEYQLPIDEKNIFDVWANLKTGALITIETWNKGADESWDGREHVTYNSVNVCIPTENTLVFRLHERTGFSHGGYNLCCFNLVHNKTDFPLQNVLGYCSNSRNWNGEHPHLWHYGDGDNINFAKILTRIYDFEDDIGTLFNMKIEKALERYKENGFVV